MKIFNHPISKSIIAILIATTLYAGYPYTPSTLEVTVEKINGNTYIYTNKPITEITFEVTEPTTATFTTSYGHTRPVFTTDNLYFNDSYSPAIIRQVKITGSVNFNYIKVR